MALNDINSTIDRGEDTRADADDATLEASAESVADDVDDTDDANMLAAATAPVDAPDVVTPAAESATAFSTTSTAVAASAAAAAKEQARNAAAYNLGAWAVTERGFNITVEPRDAVERSDYNRAWQEVENGMENECNSRINGSSSCSEHSTEDEPMQQENDVNETDLARAIAVEEGDDDVFNGPRGDLPTALELDPDAKSAAFHARSKINFYGMFVASMVLLVVLTATITWQLVHIPQIPAALSDRATLGIREYITQQLLVRLPADIGGGNRSKEDVEQLLNDPTDPYRKALDWIQNEDPMALTPDSAKFIQRFLAAYLYFSTSVDHPWSNGCEPLLPTTAPSTSSANDQGAGARPGDNSCVHVFGDAVFGDAAYVGYTNEMVAKRWLSSDDECLWGGVHCDWDGNIVVLDFCSTNMTGSFPEGVASFPVVRKVSLCQGELNGPLPSVLGEGKHLLEVELSGNQFSGAIPDRWYRSRSLQKVNLGANRLTGTISEQVHNWKDLRGLFLFENALVGTIPGTIGALKSLNWLMLGSNQLSGTIPSTIGGLNHAMRVNLQRNLLTGSIPSELGNLLELVELRLESNKLNLTIPTELSVLSELWTLTLNDNQLSGSILSMANTSSLALGTLQIENNRFSGTIPSELGRLKELVHFTASGNRLSGTVPRKVCNLVNAKNRLGLKKLVEFQLDCAIPNAAGEVAEISCPDGCCTHCCDPDGKNCQAMI